MAKTVMKATRQIDRPAKKVSTPAKKGSPAKKVATPAPAPVEEDEEESSSEEEGDESSSDEEGDKERSRKEIIEGTTEHRDWLARANRIGSKREVINGTTNYRGTDLRTVGKLTADDLERVPVLDENGDQKMLTVTDKKGNVREYERVRIKYKSRHLVGNLIHKLTHEKLKDLKDVEKRKKEVKDYFTKESKKGEAGVENSSMYKKYDAIKTMAQLNTHNDKVQKSAKKWDDTKEKMRSYFDKPKGQKPSNSKKIRLRGHFSTSGKKHRKCLVNLGFSDECAKEDCDKKKINASRIHKETKRNQGGKKYCASPSKKILKGRRE
jgi:hypothetical protein